MFWTDGTGSFRWGWPRMSLGCHARPVSGVRTVLLGSFPQVSSVASDVGPLVCSDVVGPWLSAVPCGVFCSLVGLRCNVYSTCSIHTDSKCTTYNSACISIKTWYWDKCSEEPLFCFSVCIHEPLTESCKASIMWWYTEEHSKASVHWHTVRGHSHWSQWQNAVQST